MLMMVLWPSFLTAICAEGFFFSLFDPRDIAFDGNPLEISPMATYTIGFFCFWFFAMLASSLTCYLIKMPSEHRPPI